MPINPDAVGAVGEESEISWTSKDSLLYALGVGAGASDPTGFELEFTTENTRDVSQRSLPTQVVVLGGGRMPDYGDFNLAKLLHGDQHIELHQELPAAGSALAQSRVAAIYDKIKAALVVLETNVRSHDGEPMWTSRAGLFISGEGGWGGDRGPSSAWKQPDREPRPRDGLRDPHRPSPPLPSQRRPQPAPLRPFVLGHGRVRDSDPARPVHVRGDGSGTAAHAVRQ